MDDQYVTRADGPVSAAMDQPAVADEGLPVREDLRVCLESQSDGTLRDLIGQAKALLAARQNERQERALATIKKLARENGLVVQAGKPGRKRGRPPKAVDGS